MGFGAALGAFVDGYQVSRKQQIAEDEGKRREAYQNKQMQVMDMQMEEQKRQNSERNSPEARSIRAMKIANETTKLKLEAKQTAMQSQAMDQIYGSMATEETSKELMALKQNFSDKTAQDNLTSVYNNMKATLADGGKIADLAPFNALAASDEVFKKKFPNPVIFYNPSDENHKKQLTAATKKMATLQGIDFTKFEPEAARDIQEQMESSVEEMAKHGHIVVDSVTGELKPIDALFGMTDVAKRAPESTVRKAAQEQEKLAQVGVETTARNQQIQRESSSFKLQTINGKKPEQLEAAYIALGKPVPTAVKEAITNNNKMLGNQNSLPLDLRGKDQADMLAYVNEVSMAAATGKVDPSYLYNAHTAINNSGLGESDKAKERVKLETAFARSETRAVFDEEAPLTTEKIEKFKSIENNNLAVHPNKKKLQDVKDEVSSNISGAKMTNDILSEMRDYATSDELFTGVFKNTAKTIVGTEDGITRKLGELSGSTDAKDIAAADKIRSSLANTIRIDTKVGMMLAKFIKEMSGTAVSESERVFLTELMTGIASGDARTVGVGLQAFRDSRLNFNEQYYNDDTYQTTLPDTMLEAKRAGNLKVDFDIPSTTSVSEKVLNMGNENETVKEGAGLVDKATQLGTDAVNRVKEDYNTSKPFSWKSMFGVK